MSDQTQTVIDTAAGRQLDRRGFVRCFLHRRLGVTAAVFLVIVIVACAAAPLIAPYGPDAEDLTSLLTGPTLHHLLGTDELGRDVLSRLLYGGVVSLEGIGEVLGVAVLLGAPLGLLSAYHGNWLDALLTRVADLGLAIPVIVVLLMVFALPDGGETEAMLVLGFLYTPALFRVVRGAALPLRDALYVVNARLAGVSTLKILWRHVLPGIAGPLAVNLSLTAGVTLVVETGLNYLGLGVAPPAPSWGGMIDEAQNVLYQQPWLVVPTGLAVAFTALAFVLVGDAVRDALAESWSLEPSNAAEMAAGVAERRAVAEAASAHLVPNPEAVLSVRGLSIAVRDANGSDLVTTDVSFDVMGGEAVGILGESGCGKTLTALAIIRLLPPNVRIVTGRCWFEGHEVVSPNSRHVRRADRIAVGYVAQDPMVNLDPCFTVGFTIGEVVRSHRRDLSRAAVRRRVRQLMESVQIPAPDEVARRYPHQLSGGLAQRVQIAMALASEPRLLIADEPTTALDVTVQAEILDLLRGLRSELGTALLLITHDWGVVADSCDRAVVMYAGEVVEQGAVTELVRGPLHPYTKALLLADPQHGTPGQRLATIPGSVPAPSNWGRGCRFLPRCDHATPECGPEPIALTGISTRRETRCIHFERLKAEASR